MTEYETETTEPIDLYPRFTDAVGREEVVRFAGLVPPVLLTLLEETFDHYDATMALSLKLIGEFNHVVVNQTVEIDDLKADAIDVFIRVQADDLEYQTMSNQLIEAEGDLADAEYLIGALTDDVVRLNNEVIEGAEIILERNERITELIAVARV